MSRGMRYGSVTTRLTGDRPDDWRDNAACRDTDPEAFFPISKDDAEATKTLCRRCDVQQECLQWALESGEDFGIWGGMTQDERREYKRIHGTKVATA